MAPNQDWPARGSYILGIQGRAALAQGLILALGLGCRLPTQRDLSSYLLTRKISSATFPQENDRAMVKQLLDALMKMILRHTGTN